MSPELVRMPDRERAAIEESFVGVLIVYAPKLGASVLS